MSTARQSLYESFSAFTYALESTDITSRDPITEAKHNNRARLLRNGLAVSGFAMVEKFIKERTGEVLDKIGDGITQFNELPDGLRTAATIGVIEAMQFQAKFIDRAHLITYYQNHSRLIASTLSNPFKISSIAFCNNYTNLSAAEIESILDSFRVENPWSVVGGVVNRLGLGVLSPKQAFENAAKRRHLAAHEITANTEFSNLSSYKIEAITFCLAYDLLLSKALKLITAKDTEYLRRRKLAGNQIEIRYIKQFSNTRWKEFKENVIRAIKVGDDYETLKNECLLRGKREGFAVIKVTETGVPLEWYTPEVDF
jgi:hypothetical protein